MHVMCIYIHFVYTLHTFYIHVTDPLPHIRRHFMGVEVRICLSVQALQPKVESIWLVVEPQPKTDGKIIGDHIIPGRK